MSTRLFLFFGVHFKPPQNLNRNISAETITEILCHNPGERCGGSNYYNCKQMKAKMLVGHTDREWRVRTLRNITINIGCSCVYREPVLLDQFSPGPEERRRKRTSVPRPFDLKSLQPQSPRR